jgi:hypothetical protein
MKRFAASLFLFLALAAVPGAAADWKTARFDRITVEVPVPAVSSPVVPAPLTAPLPFPARPDES